MRQQRISANGLTIDSSYSKDLDDAFWVEPSESGYQVDISIADVASFIKKNSKWDISARQRKETQYLRNFNRPMLPHNLSENLCSLLPEQPRKVLTIRLQLDNDFRVCSVRIHKAQLVSTAKLSHQDVDTCLLTEDHPLKGQLTLCQKIAQAFYDARRARGALAFYDVHSHLYADENGIVRKYEGPFFHAQMIVQEFMIMANEQMAQSMAHADVPFLYRNHEATAAAPTQRDMLGQVHLAMQRPELLPVLAERMQLWVKKAQYGTKVLGHYGLNLAAYTHATSPIRRYADLVNQRILKAIIQGFASPYTQEELDTLAEEINQWHLEHQEAKATAMKTKTVAERRQQLQQLPLHTLSSEQFSKLFKRAVKDDQYTEELETEVKNRLAAETMTALDGYYLFFEATAGWRFLQEAFLAFLGNHPHLAVSILEIAKAKQSLPVGLITVPFEQGFASQLQVQLNGSPTTAHGFAQAPSKKESQQLAVLHWLYDYTAGTLRFQPIDLEQKLAHVTDTKEPGNTNYVGRLMELCQAKKWPAPDYQFHMAGPSHTPTIGCQVRLNLKDQVWTAAAEAANRKDAKQKASAQLYQQLSDIHV